MPATTERLWEFTKEHFNLILCKSSVDQLFSLGFEELNDIDLLRLNTFIILVKLSGF